MTLIARLAALLGPLLLACAAAAQVPDDVPIGAIRWDAWFDDAPDRKALELPAWRHRAPFFARTDEAGRLRLDGDMEHVLHAEVAYARAMGVDYFVFGFYPDTGSWGRKLDRHLALNRALRSYLRLPDRMGVRFALSLNQLFPAADIEDMADTVAAFVAHPDYMRTENGRAPVYILGHDGLDWSRFFGSDDAARKAVETFRRKARERPGVDLTFILLHYEPAKATEAALRYGLDMLGAYTTFAPGQGAVEQAFAACSGHGAARWQLTARMGLPYVPNVTLGWDSRPRFAPEVNTKGKAQGPWCARPEAAALGRYFRDAAVAASAQPAAVPFRSILVYAWNEWAEGGWMAPNVSEGGQWMEVLRRAIGRERKPLAAELSWPDTITPAACPLRTAERDRKALAARCSAAPPPATDWPCPPGTEVAVDSIRSPSGLESLLWPGGWRTRMCTTSF